MPLEGQPWLLPVRLAGGWSEPPAASVPGADGFPGCVWQARRAQKPNTQSLSPVGPSSRTRPGATPTHRVPSVALSVSTIPTGQGTSERCVCSGKVSICEPELGPPVGPCHSRGCDRPTVQSFLWKQNATVLHEKRSQLRKRKARCGFSVLLSFPLAGLGHSSQQQSKDKARTPGPSRAP